VKSKSLAPLVLAALCGLLPAQESVAPELAAGQESSLSLEQQLQDLEQLRFADADSREIVQCLHSIGRVGSEEAVDTLLEMIPGFVGREQMAAVHAVFLAGSPYAFSRLRELAVHRGLADVRRQACRDLVRLSEDDRLFLRDKRLKEEKDLRIRGEILRHLIEQDVPGLENAILKAAKSKEAIYASAGVFGIGRLHIARGRKLVEAAARDADMQLRRDAFRALGALGGPRCFRLLLDAYDNGSNLMHRPVLVEALRLADEEKEVAMILERGLHHRNVEVVRAAADVASLLAPAFPESCEKEMLRLLDHADDQVRSAAIEGLVRSGSTAAVERLVARLDSSDFHVRSDALWALSRLGSLPASAEDTIVGLARDGHAEVRTQAAAALCWYPHSAAAFDAVHELLQDASWSVRSMAVECLVCFRRPESLASLVRLIEVEDGRVRDDAIDSLCRLTGEDFGPLSGSWKMWLADRPQDYELPSAEDALVSLERKRAVRRGNGQSMVRSAYHGLDVPRGGVIFVLDVSGSMDSRFDSTSTFLQHFSAALGETIASLPPETSFNIVLFSSGVSIWRDELEIATPDSIEAARVFLDDARAGGGTDLYDALIAALSFEHMQTVFLLTDGAPTIGSITQPAAIVREVERLNRNRRVRIHTIAAGTARADFLAELAAANGGKAVDLTGLDQEATAVPRKQEVVPDGSTADRR
jgi:HEAT repeat protein/uncharacterized protein YegL